ncbi:MAG: DUF3800 domain-containing protein [Clostridia bacterium]|nr:DUF3800 domain-containing protein [Clostridia bacterium]
MNTYYAFTDESGTFNNKDSPFYIRCTVLIKIEEYRKLSTYVNNLKKELNIPLNNELKWSDIYIRKNSPRLTEYTYLQNLDKETKKEFVKEVVYKAKDCGITLIYTITDNNRVSLSTEEEKDSLIQNHIQYMFQRIQMHLQKSNSYTLVIMDELTNVQIKKYKKFFSNILNNGDLIDTYNTVYPGILVDESEKSIGLQMADYFCGIMNGALRKKNSNNSFDFSLELYNDIALPCIRHEKEKILGCGIIDIPHNSSARESLIFLTKKQSL